MSLLPVECPLLLPPSLQRAQVLERLAELLKEKRQLIEAANRRDLEQASSLPDSTRSRLILSEEKLESLMSGLQQLAERVRSQDMVGEVLRHALVAEDLELVQERVPIGVLLVIFEARPDCLPQVCWWVGSGKVWRMLIPAGVRVGHCHCQRATGEGRE